MSNDSASFDSTARKLLPILGWIATYRREWLLPDIFAGAALWAVMVPEGMAYAGIVGVPAVIGPLHNSPSVTRLRAAWNVTSARGRTGHRYGCDLSGICRRHRNSGYCGI
jgi:hypothetical protein